MSLNKDNLVAMATAGVVMTGGAGIRGLSREVSHSSVRISKGLTAVTQEFAEKEADHIAHPPRHNKSVVQHTDVLAVPLARIATSIRPSFKELSDGAQPLSHDYREEKKSQQPKRQQLPLVVDLRTRANPIQDQGQEQSCSAFATVAAMETWIHTHTDLQVKLSESSLWNMYKKLSSRAAIQNAAGQANSYVSISAVDGIPVNFDNWRLVLDLPATRFDLKGTQEVLEQVALKNPVIMATQVNQSFSETKDGWIRTDGPSSDDGHAFTVVGYRLFPEAPQQSYFIIRNSWGTKWGDRGYGYLPLSYCKKFHCVGHAITKVRFLNLDELPNSGPVIR